MNTADSTHLEQEYSGDTNTSTLIPEYDIHK